MGMDDHNIRIDLPAGNHEAMCALAVELSEQGAYISIIAALGGGTYPQREGNIVSVGHDYLVFRFGRDKSGRSVWDDHAIDFDDLLSLEVIELR